MPLPLNYPLWPSFPPSQCLTLRDTEATKDDTHDPSLDTDGFSVSLWVKAQYSQQEFYNAPSYTRYFSQCLMSTGELQGLVKVYCMKENRREVVMMVMIMTQCISEAVFELSLEGKMYLFMMFRYLCEERWWCTSSVWREGQGAVMFTWLLLRDFIIIIVITIFIIIIIITITIIIITIIIIIIIITIIIIIIIIIITIIIIVIIIIINIMSSISIIVIIIIIIISSIVCELFFAIFCCCCAWNHKSFTIR